VIHFVFENIVNDCEFYNFVNCPDNNPWSGHKRFKSSPIASTMIRFRAMASSEYKQFAKNVSYSLTIPETGKYIIPSAVAHSPIDWCGPDNNGNGISNAHPSRENLFEYLKPEYYNDVVSGRAFLLLDQSHEGYQPSWLWEWFHNSCEIYNIPLEQIIYCTGNLDCTTQYEEWTNSRNIIKKMLVLPYPHFEMVIHDTSNNNPLWKPYKPPAPTFTQQLLFKQQEKNIKNIKLYNALQKRPRAHRTWLFSELHKHNLLDDGINSMNHFELANSYYEGRTIEKEDYDNILPLLPMIPDENPEAEQIESKFADGDCGKYLTALNDRTMLSTWFSVISEASHGDSEGQCFISEKTFKALICNHPFIIYGNKNSLMHLRNMGYKTFSPFIDETYDTLPTWERLDAIIKEIHRLKQMTTQEILNWYIGMKDILEHNANTIKANSSTIVPPAIAKIKEYMEQ
jgi:hypothetical protein